MKIKDIKANQNITLEKAEVTEVGEVREFNKFGNVGKVSTVKIKDASGQAEITLWNDEVGQFKEGDQIKVTDAWVKEWNGKLQISAGKKGKFEKL